MRVRVGLRHVDWQEAGSTGVDLLLRARLAAAALIAAAGVLVALGKPAPAVLALGTAVAVFLLVTEPVVPAAAASAGATGAMEALASLATALKLAGRGIVAPPSAALPKPRLFVPSRDAKPDEIPPLLATDVVHRGPPGVLGLSLPPPGLGLYETWKNSGAQAGAGPEKAAADVRGAFASMGLGHVESVERRGTILRVRYVPGVYADACRRTRTDLSPWDVQGGCPACSLAQILVAVAHEAPVAWVSTGETDAGAVVLEMEVFPRSPR